MQALLTLKQETREGIAVSTHGCILLTREQEQDVTEALGKVYVDWEKNPETLNCDDVFPRWEAHRHERSGAIVKDYVPPAHRPRAAPQIPQICADLDRLHGLGILVQEVLPGNYPGGKLVDFSMACTMYHRCLKRLTAARTVERRLEGFSKFEDMIELWAFSKHEGI